MPKLRLPVHAQVERDPAEFEQSSILILAGQERDRSGCRHLCTPVYNLVLRLALQSSSPSRHNFNEIDQRAHRRFGTWYRTCTIRGA